ncbi:MAG: hypothetical protein P4L93_10770 [Coriobacteriia bacterium]|nr:hypothetical protein [Coriobacteriia bacterium]
MPPEPRAKASNAEILAVAIVAVVAVALAAYRATFGVSLYDDSHYVTVALRLAQGARPFADEMSVQSLGFMPSAAFVGVWWRLFGLDHLVMAYRLFYVALATAVGSLAYSQLRRSFRPVVSAMAVAVVLLCPPFNLIAPGYNLMTALGFLAATALAHRAWTDRSGPAAAGAGAALVFASVTYPPLCVAALVFVVTFLALTRDKRLAAWMLGACAVASLAFVTALLSTVSIAEIRQGISYASANVVNLRSPLDKFALTFGRVWASLSAPTLWPMWLAALVACIGRVPARVRAALLLAVPMLAFVRSLEMLSSHGRLFGTTAASWLITFVLAVVLPSALWAWWAKRNDVLGLLALAAPAAMVGFLTVIYSTDAGWLRAVPVIGLTPLSLAVLVAWGSAIEDLWGERALWSSALLAVVLAMTMLWATTIDDGWPIEMHAMLTRGAYAGMHVPASRLAEFTELEAAAARWVKPDARVTFYGERQAYLLTGGHIYTNAVWLYPSPSYKYSLAYFAAHGGMPDVVFTDQFAMRLRGMLPYKRTAKTDPFIARLITQYRLVQIVDDFGIWVRR